MDKSEIALQLTLKAMDTGMVRVTTDEQAKACTPNAKHEETNPHNAKQVALFYNSVMQSLEAKS